MPLPLRIRPFRQHSTHTYEYTLLHGPPPHTHTPTQHNIYQGLFFVEGINRAENMDCDNPHPAAAWWGGSFEVWARVPLCFIKGT